MVIAVVNSNVETMRWRRFILLILLGFMLSYGFACADSNSTATPPQATPQIETSTLESDVSESRGVAEEPVASLSPETRAIAASAGPEGLYNPQRGDVRLVVISDLNSAYGSTDYDSEVDKGISLIPFWQPDMVVCSGDMVAGQNLSIPPEQLQAMWEAFDVHVAAPLRHANLPFGFTVGNHDASGALGADGKFRFQKERDIATEYWQNPQHDPGVKFSDRYEFPFYYTFEHEGIFFMAWDGSSHNIPDEKLAWVEKTLASEEAQQAKMRILLGHLPLYGVAVGRDQPGEVMANADQLRELLERHNVHTYISGHQHAYYPAHKGNLQLLHAGLLGSGPRPLIDGDFPPSKSITVVDINFDAPVATTYTTYDMQTLKLIEYDQLPRFLTGHNGIVLRRDVEMDELTASEKALCENRLGSTLCSA